MEKLKRALSSAPALKPLVYTPEDDGFVGGIVLGVDAYGLGFGAILQQEDRESRRHPVRYESGLWTPAETRYNAVKLHQQEIHLLPGATVAPETPVTPETNCET